MSRNAKGLDVSSLREMSALQNLKHPNIINLEEIVVGKDEYEIYLLLEYCDYTLYDILYSDSQALKDATKKYFFHAFLTGLAYLHCNKIIHRDLKPTNLLISSKGILKIADFGLARPFSVTGKKMTPATVTLAYRAPEILFGAEDYSSAVDMWSAGCILGELILRRPLFRPGDSELSQIKEIMKLIGPPTRANCPAFSKIESTLHIDLPQKGIFEVIFDCQSANCLKLLLALLKYDADSRAIAQEAVDHAFFAEEPKASLQPSWAPRKTS